MFVGNYVMTLLTLLCVSMLDTCLTGFISYAVKNIIRWRHCLCYFGGLLRIRNACGLHSAIMTLLQKQTGWRQTRVMAWVVSRTSQACDSDHNGLCLHHCDAIQSEGLSFISIELVLVYIYI